MKPNCGVYQITNLVNGKRYIGSTCNLIRRKSNHKRKLEMGRHPCLHLQNSFDKHGMENFTFSVLVYCEKDDLLFYEQALIDIHKPEYNIRKVAQSNYGLVASEETRKKLSAAKKGMPTNNHNLHASEEQKKKTSEKLKGVPKTEEHKRNISSGKLGHVVTPEQNEKRRLTMIERGYWHE